MKLTFNLTERETVDALAKIATLCHNRACTRTEFREYGGTGEQWRWLRGQGYIAPSDGRTYYPTASGWQTIDRFVWTACLDLQKDLDAEIKERQS